MREIKFRAWKEESKSMYSPDDNNGEMFMYLDGILCYDGSPTEKYILMQFTGLKDKNGKEIYEGDIVKNCDVARPIANVVDFISTLNMARYIPSHLEQCEVIGNIYENPELLKENLDA